MLLHSFIPHQHANELGSWDETKAIEDADGLIDYVRFLFLTDLGEGHMETFDQEKEFALEFKYPMNSVSSVAMIPDQVSPLSFNKEESSYISNYEGRIPIIRQYLLSHVEFRGPPKTA